MEIYKNPNCKKVRGSHVLEVACAYCKCFIANYQKVGESNFVKMYNERIIIEYINLSEEERRVSNLLEKAQATREAEDYYIYSEGKTEGKIEIAKTMLAKGYLPDVTSECTGLTLERVVEIKIQMDKAKPSIISA